MRKHVLSGLGSACLALVAASAGAATTKSPATLPEDVTGVVVNMAKGATLPLTLHIDSFTTLSEAQSIAKTVSDKGQAAVAAALAEVAPRGWIRVGDTIGFTVPVIRTQETDEGTEIFAILDRPFPLFEQLEGIKSADHPYGVVRFFIKPDGSSSGELVAAAQALFGASGKITMESYTTKPYPIIGAVVRTAALATGQPGK